MRLLDLFVFKYNRTDFHELNLDWIISDMKTIAETLQNFISLNVIKYADPIQWNITTQYEANTVVVDANDGTAYLSVQAVPSGVAITNTDYWTPIFTLNLLSANQNITLRDDGSNVLATFSSDTDDWLIWNSTLYKVSQPIAINEAYVVGYNLTRYTVELFINDYVTNIINNIGNLTNLSTTDKSSIVNAINEINQTLQDIKNIISSRYVYNVKDYGAAGDNLTDDTDAFNATIAAANLTGGTIIIPSGTYIISDELTPISNFINVIGEKYATINSTITTDQTLITCDSSGISIKNLTFHNDTKTGICIDTNTLSLIENCTITQYDTQIYINASAMVKVIKNYMTSPGSYQILIENPDYPDTGDHLIAFNTFDASTRNFSCVRVNSGGGLFIQSNKMMNARYPIFEAIDVSATSIILIEGNSIENYTDAGVYLGSAATGYIPITGIVINGNQFTSATGTAVSAIDRSSLINIENNVISGGGANGQYAFILGTTATAPTKVKIKNNNIQNIYGGCLYQGNAEYCDVEIEKTDSVLKRLIYSILTTSNTNRNKGVINVGVASGTNQIIGTSNIPIGRHIRYSLSVEGDTSADYTEGIVINNSPSVKTDIVAGSSFTISLGATSVLFYHTNDEAKQAILTAEGSFNMLESV